LREPTRRALITCAPPNPNGDLHLGHLSGPFLGADVLRRYLAARGHEVHYVSYTDDHSCYVERKATELGRTPRETSFTYTRRIEETLARAGMLPHYYEHPHREPVHDQVVHDHFLRLHRAGTLAERDLPVPWCEHCRSYRYEAGVRGRCPACGQPSDGMYCEDCGRPHEPEGVAEGVCTRCQHPTTMRTIRRLVFPLDRYGERLADYYAGRDWRPKLLDYCGDLVKQGLPPTPVSRRTSYGIPVPLSGWNGHILDTWYSGIFGYLAATMAYGTALGRQELWRELWLEPDTAIIHFIGFDCSFSHAVLWPALLMALGGLNLPRHVITNEFYNLEGGKFSTSRNHAIWGTEFLREVPADALRLHLCLTSPETVQTSFQERGFAATNNDLLVGGLEAWAAGLLDLLREDCGSVVPERRGGLPEALGALRSTLPDEVGRHLEPATFSLRSAAARLAAAVEAAGADLARLRLARDGAGYHAGLAAHAELLATVATVAAPLMPAWAGHARQQLGLPAPAAGAEPPWPVPEAALVQPGQRVSAWFRRLFHER